MFVCVCVCVGVLVCCAVSLCVVCGACVGVECVVCGCLWCACVCRFKTPPCVPAKRPCHIRHGRFGGTHGDVLNLHTKAF